MPSAKHTLIAVVALVVSALTQSLRLQAQPTSANDDYSPRVQAGLKLTRSGQWAKARVLAETYLAGKEGLPSSQERCAMLVVAAYSNALLHENAKGDVQLRSFDAACKAFPLPYGWHTEAGRVRRILDGENANTVYPSMKGRERTRG